MKYALICFILGVCCLPFLYVPYAWKDGLFLIFVSFCITVYQGVKWIVRKVLA